MSRDDEIARVLAEWQARLEEGAAADPEELIRQHPELEEELRKGIAAMQVLDRLLEGGPGLAGAAPRKLGEFTILREIGRGGMGVVYEAEQASMRRRVALKALYPRIGRSERAVERFQREARAAGKAHHTNIVPVYGLGREGGVWFYAMELVEGTSLARLLDDMRKLGAVPGGPEVDGLTTPSLTPPAMTPPRGGVTPHGPDGYFHRVAGMFAEVAEALEAAHEVGVIHRDLKPSNLILADDGRLKLIDFGLAWMRGEESLVTASGERLGTPLYMSPELARGEKVDARSDIYSLGTTLYEVLTLRPPHRGERAHEIVQRILTREPPRLRRLNPRVPRDLETLVHKALEKEPVRRYASAAEFARDLRGFASGEGIRARPVGPAGRLWRRAKRHRVASSLAIAVLVLLGLGAGLWIKAGRHAARERDVTYRMLCARAEVALARSEEDRQSRELRVQRPSSARELFSEAIELDPGRPEAYLGRAQARSEDHAQNLADLEVARKHGLAARSYHLARAYVFERAGRKEEAARERERGLAAPRGGALDAFLEGRLLVVAGRFQDALPHLDTAIRDAPEDSLHRHLALMVRAVARRRVGDLEGAIEDLSVLRAPSGDSRAIRVWMASVWRELERRDQAEELFRPVLAEVARDGREAAWLRLLQSLRLEEDLGWFDEVTERACTAHPNAVDLLLERQRCLAARGEVATQVARCKRILELDPGSVRGLEGLALGLLRSGEAGEALAAVDGAIELAPREAALHNTRGMILLALRKLEDAEAAFRASIDCDPGAAIAWSNRAAALELLDRDEEAVTVARKALELARDAAETWAYLGGALRDLRRFDESVAAFERGIALGAQDPYVIGHYGMALDHAGRSEEGLAKIDEALEMAARLTREGAGPLPAGLAMLASDPHLIGVRTGRIAALLRLGRYEEALAEADACIARDPERAKPHAFRGVALLQTGKIEEAAAACERAATLDPELHDAWCTLGEARRLLGQLEAARSAQEKAIALAPECLASNSVMAQVLDALGALEESLRFHEEAIRLDEEAGMVGAAAQVRARYAWSLFRLGRTEDALEQHRRCAEAMAEDAFFHMRHALYLAWLDRFDEGARAFQRGVSSPIQETDAAPSAVGFLLLTGKSRHAVAKARRGRASDRRTMAVPYLRALRAAEDLEAARDIAAGLVEDEDARERDPLELAWLRAVAEDPKGARAALDRVQHPWHPFAAYERARIHALLGETDAALQWLARARDAGFRWPSRAAEDPDFSVLADDPRYRALRESMIRKGP